MYEASQWPSNTFVTLTYDDEHLPADGSLDVTEFQRFMKRLRKARESKVRFFHCGEYGDINGRPHYHALLFNVFFPDRYKWRSSTFRSAELESLWRLGHCELGEVTFESAAYVARYHVKKVTGGKQWEHYERLNPLTGEMVQVAREYATMSRRPGIGRDWFEQFADEVYPRDSVLSGGHSAKPPRYFDKILESVDPVLATEVRAARAREADHENGTEERLQVREMCRRSRFTLQQRRLG